MYLATYDRQRNWSPLGYILVAAFLSGLFFFAGGCAAWSRGRGYGNSVGVVLGLLGGLSPFFLLWGVISLELYSAAALAALFLLGTAGCVSVVLLAVLPDRRQHPA
jgi:hypothetical protein